MVVVRLLPLCLLLLGGSEAFPSLGGTVLGRRSTYNEPLARRLFNLAAAAYGQRKEECLRRTYDEWERTSVSMDTATECDAFDNTCALFIAHSDVRRELVLVFRGTTTPKQLAIEGWQSRDKPDRDFFGLGNVNAYFYNAHQALWSSILSVIGHERYYGYHVAVTGHSLGGALAALAAVRIVRDGLRRPEQMSVYTFGEPRVGSRHFAYNFDRLLPESFRVVFRRDIVPHLPACVKQQPIGGGDPDSKPCDPQAVDGYWHHSTEIWYPESMASDGTAHFVECLGGGEDFSCSDRIHFHPSAFADYVADHRNYFNVTHVANFGKAGCDVSRVPVSFVQNVKSRFRSLLDRIGL